MIQNSSDKIWLFINIVIHHACILLACIYKSHAKLINLSCQWKVISFMIWVRKCIILISRNANPSTSLHNRSSINYACNLLTQSICRSLFLKPKFCLRRKEWDKKEADKTLKPFCPLPPPTSLFSPSDLKRLLRHMPPRRITLATIVRQ